MYTGFDKMPEISTEMRKNVINIYNEKGIEFLQKEVELKDPIYYKEVDKKESTTIDESIRDNLFNKQNIFKLQNKKFLKKEILTL